MWDATIKYEPGITPEVVKVFMTRFCKRWVFQKEKGSVTGFEHYQCRFSLHKKMRMNQILALVELEGISVWLTPTHVKDFSYVMKEDTRMEGPWSDKDLLIPRHLRDNPKWYPYQEVLNQYIKDPIDQRKILVIVDKDGCTGKSFWTCWWGVRTELLRIPVMNDYKDICRIVMDQDIAETYVIDMPRAMDKKHLHNFYSAIEDVKNGYVFDDRYEYKSKYFDIPRVIVFTNTEPDQKWLSLDRWDLRYINPIDKILYKC